MKSGCAYQKASYARGVETLVVGDKALVHGPDNLSGRKTEPRARCTLIRYFRVDGLDARRPHAGPYSLRYYSYAAKLPKNDMTHWRYQARFTLCARWRFQLVFKPPEKADQHHRGFTCRSNSAILIGCTWNCVQHFTTVTLYLNPEIHDACTFQPGQGCEKIV